MIGRFPLGNPLTPDKHRRIVTCMTSTTNTATKPIIVIGESKGDRAALRRGIARHFGVGQARVRFFECPNFEIETHRKAFNLDHTSTVVTLGPNMPEWLVDQVWG